MRRKLYVEAGTEGGAETPVRWVRRFAWWPAEVEGESVWLESYLQKTWRGPNSGKWWDADGTELFLGKSYRRIP